MNYNLVLPLLALVLAILAAFFPFRAGDHPPVELKGRIAEIRAGSFLAALAILLFAGATLLWPKTFAQGSWIALGLAVGALVAVFSAGADAPRAGFAFGMAALGAGAIHFVPAAGLSSAQMAMLVGAFVGAFASGGLRPKLTGGYLCAFAAVPIVAADYLGRAAMGSDPYAASGLALGIAFLVAAVVAGLVSRATPSPLVRNGIGFVLLLLAGYLVCWKFLDNADLANLWAGGAAVGLIVHLIFAGEEQPEAFRFVLSAVIWLAAAAVAFGFAQGHGMAIAILGGAATLVLFGSIRALMTLSLAVAILIYRLFREIYPEESRALDIGQHYTMVGIAVGALLPVLPLEWARGRRFSASGAFLGALIWLVILCGLPVAAAVLLGSKGAIGMVVGLSFAALVEGLRGSVSLAPVGIAGGLGCLTVLSYGWLGDWADLERAAKVKAIVIVAVAAVLLGGVLLGLSRSQADEPVQP